MRSQVLWVISAVLVVGCGGVTLPDKPANEKGVIVGRDVRSAIGGPNIFVKNDPADSSECGNVFLVEGGTDIGVRDADGRLHRGDVEDLKIGRRVNVWIDMLFTSCPGQATANAVEILPD